MNDAAHRWPIRVYYEDTDFSGVVYHASYLRFLERGRTEFLRAAGIGQADLHAGRAAAFAVRTMTIEFRASARMDDLLTVVSEVEAVGGASISMRQRIEREGLPLVTASVRLGLVGGGRPLRLPPALVAQLTARHGTSGIA